MKAIFNHCNINVTDLKKSIAFYKEALGLEVVKEKEASDGSFKLVYLSDGVSPFSLELTWLKDHPQFEQDRMPQIRTIIHKYIEKE